MFQDIPIVAGEIGSGGVARRVPPVVKEFGSALVYGHGSFCAGRNDFRESFLELVKIENLCREEYFRMLDGRLLAV